MLKHNGYTGHVEFDDEADIFHSEVLDTRDVITFQGKTVENIKTAFRESIDDYLDFCASRGKNPNTSFSGKLMVKMNPELHHKIYHKAIKSAKNFNDWIVETLEKNCN
ncbi:type II toxin-antitoxin system HicB family antitoxin [candidate division KSB1 bacterium]|nr:type II toxin-antitoxin system HicB family antitoxin [candidate division KSB1 bacterium]MBL7092893.1 type II toxin-antitoxin system HicB family antitoxin [candidate division KSB1 bacterium]